MYICRERYQNGSVRNYHVIAKLVQEKQQLTQATENLRKRFDQFLKQN